MIQAVIEDDVVLRIKKSIVVESFDDGALLLNLNTEEIIDVDSIDSWLLDRVDGSISVNGLKQAFIKSCSPSIVNAEQLFYDKIRSYTERKILYPVGGGREIYMDETYYIQNSDVNIREEDDDGALLYNPDLDQVKLLSLSGTFIWKLCSVERTVGDIVKAIRQNFDDVPEEDVIADVEDFLEQMLVAGFMAKLEK